MLTASISSTTVSTCTVRKPSRFRLRSPRFSCDRCRAITFAPNCRSARCSLRSTHTRSGGSSTIATGRTSYSRARFTSSLRASGCTLVASITVNRPAGQALARDEVQDVERVFGRRLIVLVIRNQPAAEVARNHLGRPENAAGRTSTSPTHWPRPEPPKHSAGTSMVVIERHLLTHAEERRAGSVGRRPGSSGPTGRNSHGVAVARPRHAPPTSRNSARVHSKRWSGWR